MSTPATLWRRPGPDVGRVVVGGAVRRARADPHPAGLLALLVVQAAVVLATELPGALLTDDLQLLVGAAPALPGPGYLLAPLHDHFVPGLSLMFWLQRHLAGVADAPSVVLRAAVLAAATVAVHRVLLALLGRRPATLLLTAVWGLSPLVLCAGSWLVVGFSQLPAQALAAAALLCHLRWTREGGARWAAAAGGLLAAAACFWEVYALTGLTFVWLSVGFLHPGTGRERVAAALARWRGWLLELAAPALYLVGFLSAGTTGRPVAPPAGEVAGQLVGQWGSTIAPGLLGGPWRWFALPGVYYSATATPAWAVATGWVASAVVVAVGVRRLRWRAAFALAVPATTVVANLYLVLLGRLTGFGGLVAHVVSYALVDLLPVVLGLALLLVWSPAAVAARVPTPAPGAHRPRRRPGVVLVGGAVAVVLAAGLMSVAGFARTWHRNPTGAYLAELQRSLQRAGPGAQLYDLPVSNRVLAVLDARRDLADVTDLLGATPGWTPRDGAGLTPDDTGRLRPADFRPFAGARGDGNSFCGNLLRGATTRRMPLDRAPGPAGWVLRLSYFQERPTPVRVRLVGADGHAVAPLRVSGLVLTGTLATVDLTFPVSAPVRVDVGSDAAAANVCLSSVAVGVVVPAAGS